MSKNQKPKTHIFHPNPHTPNNVKHPLKLKYWSILKSVKINLKTGKNLINLHTKKVEANKNEYGCGVIECEIQNPREFKSILVKNGAWVVFLTFLNTFDRQTSMRCLYWLTNWLSRLSRFNRDSNLRQLQKHVNWSFCKHLSVMLIDHIISRSIV